MSKQPPTTTQSRDRERRPRSHFLWGGGYIASSGLISWEITTTYIYVFLGYGKILKIIPFHLQLCSNKVSSHIYTYPREKGEGFRHRNPTNRQKPVCQLWQNNFIYQYFEYLLILLSSLCIYISPFLHAICIIVKSINLFKVLKLSDVHCVPFKSLLSY